MTIPRFKIKGTLAPPKVKIRTPVPFPVNVAGTGGIRVSKENGVWVIEPDFSALASLAASAVADPTAKEVWIYDPAIGEYNVLTLAALGDALYKLTSTSSVLIGAGPRTFATQTGKDIGVGSWVLITSDANPTSNWMAGQVTAYASGALSVDVSAFGGSGTLADWTIRASGARGPDRSAGVAYRWSTNTAASDPGAGFVKANNATFASISALYLSETDADGNILAAEIATWDDSTSTIKGRLRIYDPVAPTNFMVFDVIGTVADAGAYDTLTVTPIVVGGAFAASAQLRITFTPRGDKGDTGPAGNATFSGAVNHGVIIATSGTTATSSAVMADGQLLVGQTGADPLPRTIGGDMTIAASGAATTSASVLKRDATNTISKGYTLTPNNIGTVTSGTLTPDPTLGNYQFYTNNGAHTLAAPSSDCAMDILVTNGASAGAITFSGFTVGAIVGDSLTTANTNKFIISVRRINGVSTYTIKALQ